MEKGFLIVFLALFCSSAAAEGVQWQATLPGAKQTAAQANKLVLVQFTAQWCKYCKVMEKEVFGQPQIASALEANYVPVKVNADNFPGTVKEFGVTGLPTTVVLSPEGKVLARIRGRREAGEFLTGLNQIAATNRHQYVAQGPAPPDNPPPAYTPPAAPAYTPPAPAYTSPTATAPGYTPPTAAAPTYAPPTAAAPAYAPPTGPPAGREPVAPGYPADPNDRYADFYNRSQPVETPAALGYGAPSNVMATPRQGETAPPYGSPVGPQIQDRPATAPRYDSPQPPVEAGVPGMAASVSTNQPNIAEQPPESNPPLCLDGHCPVSLIEKKDWVVGDRKWGAIHRGRTYLFRGPEEQKRFLEDPDRYAPVMSGCDVVLAVEEGRTVDGLRQHGAFFGNRIYLFVNEANLQKFEASPNRYANAILQAMINSGQKRYY